MGIKSKKGRTADVCAIAQISASRFIAEDGRFASAWKRGGDILYWFWRLNDLCSYPAPGIGRGELSIRYGCRAWRTCVSAPLLHPAFNPGSTHAAKLQTRFVEVSASDALGADTAVMGASFHLTPLQPHTASAAKLIFCTVLSTTEGTKHEALRSFLIRCLAHSSPRAAAQLLLGCRLSLISCKVIFYLRPRPRIRALVLISDLAPSMRDNQSR